MTTRAKDSPVNAAQQLARFRTVAPAMTKAEANRANGANGGRPKTHGLHKPSVPDNPVNAADFIPEMNSPEWREGYERGRNASKDAAGDSIKRFARLRRDHPQLADLKRIKLIAINLILFPMLAGI